MQRLVELWADLAYRSTIEMGLCVADGYAHDPEGLARALIDAGALGDILAGAVDRGVPLTRDVVLVAERLLQAVQATQSIAVAREIDRVLAALEGEDAQVTPDALHPFHVFQATRALHLALARAYGEGSQAA
jgi:hypothetical protein